MFIAYHNDMFNVYVGDYSGFDKDEPTSASHGKAKVVEHLKSKHHYKR